MLHPWHRRVLRLLVREGRMFAAEIGARLYVTTPAWARTEVAQYELRELRKLRLVERDYGRPERWHPALFAAAVLPEPKWPTSARDLAHRAHSA